MLNIRKGVIETNSSSVHCIVLSQSGNRNPFPASLTLRGGEFGWEFDKLTTPEEKAYYLYTAMYCIFTWYDDRSDFDAEVEKLLNVLSDVGICAFAEEIKEEDWCSIDHSEDLPEFLAEVLSSPENILNFLFSHESYVLTGNDNSDHTVYAGDIYEEYPHKVFEKGN